MKKLTILSSCLLVLALASCSGDPASSAPSSEVQTDWTLTEKTVFETHLGEGNNIPFYSLLPILGYEVVYEPSCDYVVIYAQGENNDYIKEYSDLCVSSGFTLESDVSSETYASLSKVLSDDNEMNRTQIVNVYIEVGMLTIDTFIETTYYSTSWPSSPSVNDLIGVDFDVVSYDENDLVSVIYYKKTLNYTPYCTVVVESSSDVANGSFIAQLNDASYILDDNKTTADDYLYYRIGEYELDDETYRYVIETSVSKEVTPIGDNYLFTIVYSCVMEF